MMTVYALNGALAVLMASCGAWLVVAVCAVVALVILAWPMIRTLLGSLRAAGKLPDRRTTDGGQRIARLRG